MTFIPYVAAVIILTAIAYGIYLIFQAGKTSELKDEDASILKVKNAQENIESRQPSTPDDLLKRMSDSAD